MRFALLVLFVVQSFSSTGQVFDSLILQDVPSILFQNDKWDLDYDLNEDLDSMLLQTLDFDWVIIEGHTDKNGSLAYNENLSFLRASRVRDRLVEIGLDSAKIQMSAHGELQPINNGNQASDLQMNRRVSLCLYREIRMRRFFGKITDESTGEGLQSMIRINGKLFQDSIVSKNDGSYDIVLLDDAIFKLMATAPGYFFAEEFVRVSTSMDPEVNLELAKIEIGEKFTLPNFNFFGGSTRMLDSSFPAIDWLYQMLAESEVCIEIAGHVNVPNAAPVKRDSKDFLLSFNRAKLVFEEMSGKGIDAHRMIYRGYGNWEMLYPKAESLADQSANRRVEIKIEDCAMLHNDSKK